MELPRIGSLFTGYGGLDLAVEAHTGGKTAWVLDNDPGPSAVLAARWPGVPNLGDVTTVDWSQVAPVDVLTGGYPCQPFSNAGKRKGTQDARHLWPHVAKAISHLRPRLVVLENVQGHLTLGGVGVVGSLASLGYGVRWGVVWAADAGSCHRRARLFIVARPADADGGRRLQPDEEQRGVSVAHAGSGKPLRFLPTPVVNDMGANKTPQEWDDWTARLRETHKNGNGHGPSLSVEAQRLTAGLGAGGGLMFPTPRATDGTKGGPNQRGSSGDLTLPSAAVGLLLSTPTAGLGAGGGQRSHRGGTSARALNPAELAADVSTGAVGGFGTYQASVDRWASTIGRPAPSPTEASDRTGKPVLSPAFVEWMMGLPAGWVTGVEGLSRAQQLKLLGNGVVPQQAALALSLLDGGDT